VRGGKAATHGHLCKNIQTDTGTSLASATAIAAESCDSLAINISGSTLSIFEFSLGDFRKIKDCKDCFLNINILFLLIVVCFIIVEGNK
jgi:hypothetical protein